MKVLGPTTSLPLLHLSQLLACGFDSFDSGDTGVNICHFCKKQQPWTSKDGWKEAHEPDCPYVAAKEFIEPFMVEVLESANA